MLVSAIHQHESATGIYICALPPAPLSHLPPITPFFYAENIYSIRSVPGTGHLVHLESVRHKILSLECQWMTLGT